MDTQLKIGIIGLGMVGEPLHRFFEEVRGFQRGANLFLYDIDPRKGYGDSMDAADIIFISVPTPRGSDGAAVTTALDDAFKKIPGEKTVVIKSTVPPGTTEDFQKQYPQHKVLFNPEFLTEAHAWENTVHPDRQLVGFTAHSRDAAPAVLALLPEAPLAAPSPKLQVSATEAEIIKYAANVFLTRKVTFANAIFEVAEKNGANYENIRTGIASDARIGPSHFDVNYQGYRGYGGYCFIKDTDALIAHAETSGIGRVADLFRADREFNKKVLADQGLTPEDVSKHDHELIQKKIQTHGK